METLNFSPNEQKCIAEFMFAYQCNILIKSEAINVLSVFKKHNFICNYNEMIKRVETQDINIVEDINKILIEKISIHDAKEIMNKYFIRAL